ncbi:CD225/dispanin family protein [Candidatus Frankia alpina]|uniref:CD225/dispanin family protein n=1 Tax=Candidatus Frankia alpina TaxID=2699483 RepID=UPI0013D368B5|nr:CD225/dispanin family protein [Candidatus Frankia alpina]
MRVCNHLGLSIVATVLCAPVGAFGLVYSLRTTDRLARGDLAGARLASRRCRAWCLAATAAGVVILGVLAAVGGT